MRITFRNFVTTLKRYKTASVLNLLGLTIAFAAFLIVISYVRFEYGFDSHHPNRERIYVVENKRQHDHWDATFPNAHLRFFFDSSPQILAGGVYVGGSYSSSNTGTSVSAGMDKPFYFEKMERITAGFTEVFNFDMIEGEARAIQEPNKVLISESQARKIYGTEHAVGEPLYFTEAMTLGETFRMRGTEMNSVQTVGGVYRDFPENSRIKNVIYLRIPDDENANEWYQGGYYGFVLLAEGASPQELIDTYKRDNAEFLDKLTVQDMRLRPLGELYFATAEGGARTDGMSGGNKLITDLLLLVGLLVIAIAAINFVNFSVALTPIRIKNINTQKVLGHPVGALRRDLVVESVFMTGLAFMIGLGLVHLLEGQAWLNRLLGFNFTLGANVSLVVITAAIALGTGVVAGIYPAWHMTSFPPALVLTGSGTVSGRAKGIRKTLIGFQYVASICLIICALFIHIQTHYIGQVDLGFDKDNLVQVRLPVEVALTKPEQFRERLLEHADITDVAFTESPFVRDEPRRYIGFHYEGEHHFHNWIGVSWNFPEMMGIELTEGRLFRPDDANERGNTSSCIISQSGAEMIGAKIGTTFSDNDFGNIVEIVGIFKDVHYESLYRSVAPMAFWTSSPERQDVHGYAYVKFRGKNFLSVAEQIQGTIREMAPSYPPVFEFFDGTLARLYLHSYNQGILVTSFSIIAVLLSIIGVFGLVVFEVQGRRKEIAVRKVLGSTVREILVMLNGGFVKIVLVCFLISIPLAWYGVDSWLDSFAYKTPMHLWVFFVALVMVGLLTFLTVTLQSYRAAIENPAKALMRG